MSRRTRIAFLAVVGAQLLFPLGVIGYNELKLATGTEVRLRVQPVDPIDFFRGEHVVLAYQISNVDHEAGTRPGMTVYVPLRKEGQYWTGEFAQLDRPSGVFIRGRATDSGGTEFGIETYFVEEGEARGYEEAAAEGDLAVDVVLDDEGGAKIKRLRVISQG
jgi:uncharacterized membrane-anchored protein